MQIAISLIYCITIIIMHYGCNAMDIAGTVCRGDLSKRKDIEMKSEALAATLPREEMPVEIAPVEPRPAVSAAPSRNEATRAWRSVHAFGLGLFSREG